MTGAVALRGVRVADFTWAWAGPYGTLLLAFLGAEVIKIESHKRLDHARTRSLMGGPVVGGPDASVIFNDLNLGKLGVTLDLAQPQGAELARRLVAVSDVVAQNMRPGAMERLGLGYEQLRQVKPDLIMISSSARGMTGPERHYAGYAPTFAALGGLAYMTGHPDGPPVPQMGTVDLRSATFLAVAVLAGLHHRAATGQGMHIDLSSSEAIIALIGEAILDYTMNHRLPQRRGNRNQGMAPHKVYRCSGEDAWVSIAVGSEAEWQALCRSLGHPEWQDDPRFADAPRRCQHQDELDALIEAWTCQRTPYEVMHTLQAAGVAAMPVMSSRDLFTDPHLMARGLGVEMEHPVVGRRTVIGPPWALSGTPARVERPAPLLGEHNYQVFGELLGLPTREIDELIQAGVIY